MRPGEANVPYNRSNRYTVEPRPGVVARKGEKRTGKDEARRGQKSQENPGEKYRIIDATIIR